MATDLNTQPTPETILGNAESPSTTGPTPPAAPERPSKLPWLLGAAAVVLLLVVLGIIALAHGNKKQDTTVTKNGKTYVSNANDKNAAIKGVEINADLKKGYTQQSLQASDLDKARKQLSDAGVADMLTVNGSTAYGTTQQTGGDAVGILWGTVTSTYNRADFVDKLNAYADSLYKQSGATGTNAAGTPLVVHTTAGTKYTVPCQNTTVSFPGEAPQYDILCQTVLGSSHAYISYSTAAGDLNTARTALETFAQGSKIELQ